jgi:RsiW-degrading membrane proteinase PrsW (M82 family)
MTLRGFVPYVVVALLLLFGASGCDSPTGREHELPLPAALAGTRDVALTYEMEPGAPPVPPRFGEDLRSLVLHRLAAASIGAEATDDERSVRIVTDEAYRDRIDELVLWTGTISLLEVAPGKALPESDGPAQIDAKPFAVLGDGAVIGWGDGPSLRIRATKGSPAESVIEAASAKRGRIVAARGHVVIGTPSFPEPDTLELSFGTGAPAYVRAAQERRLLTSPRLPALRRAAEAPLPPNRSLALACLVLPIVLSIGWLAFVRRFDRAHPEPIWLVGATFLLGGLATIPAGLFELGFSRASPWLDPNLVTLGGRMSALPIAVVVFSIVVGLSEEGCKRLAAEFAVRRREFDEPIDGIVYGIVASLGFAAAENIHYFALGRLSAPLVIGRSFMSVPAHMFFGAIWGHALGARLVDPKRRAWPWLLAAAGCHGLFDALLSIENAALFAVTLNVVLASVFVALVRDALRHGVVTKEMRAIRTEDRVLVPVGRPALFWLSAIAVHLLAFGIFLLGAYYQLAHTRPTLAFVVGSSVMVALLAVAALGVSTTMELDVAIDDYGVTFAGAARPWAQIRGVSLAHQRVVLDCDGGPVLVGPAPAAVLETIAAEIRRRTSHS